MGCNFYYCAPCYGKADPFFFVGVRFAVAALIQMTLFWRHLRRINRQELLAGVTIGLCIVIGYGFQTWGMKTISSSQSAFMTALYVPLVPLLQWFFLKRRPGMMSWCGVMLAFTGLVLLSGGSDDAVAGFGIGEMVTMLSALTIAGEVILTSGFAGKTDTRHVTLLQLIFASLFSFLLMIPAGEGRTELSSTLLWSAVGLGVMSAAIQLTMNWAQRSISPTRATVIYAGEPLWAGMMGRIAGERLPGIALLGGALIVAGVIVNELRWKQRKRVTATELK